MNCKDFNLLIIEDIYDEISPENKKLLEKHIKSCSKCQKEYHELNSTSSLLNSWEDTMLKESVVPFNSFKPKRSRKIWYRTVLAAAALFLIFSILNFRLSIQDNRFDISFSLFGSSVSDDQLAANILSSGTEIEQIQLMINLIEESKRLQKEEMVTILTDFYQAIEMRRQADLKVIAQGMESLRSITDNRMDETDQVLDGLIQFTGSVLEKSVSVKKRMEE